MKKLLSLFAFALIFISFNTHPIEITQHMTGSWYNRDQEGHGFNIEMIGPNKSVFYWYVYNPDGTPTWLVGRGPHNGARIEGVAYHNTGMVWGEFDPNPRTQERWGTVNIDFTDCNHANVEYQADELGEQTIPYGFGSFHMTRLTYVHKSKCSEVPHAGIYKGYFYSETSEEGYPGTVLIDGQGFIVGFVMDFSTFWGDHTVSGKDFGSIGSVYGNATGEKQGDYSAQGRIVEDYRLFFEYLIPMVDSGMADVYPVTQLYFRGLTLASLAGNYELENQHTFDEGTATIGTDGVITGTDDAGCIWNGQITIADTGFNMFDIQLTVTECGDSNGVYQGKGYQDDAEDLEDGMAAWVFAFNENWGVSVLLTRVP